MMKTVLIFSTEDDGSIIAIGLIQLIALISTYLYLDIHLFICSFVVFHDEAKRTQQGDLLGFISLAGPSVHLIITMGSTPFIGWFTDNGCCKWDSWKNAKMTLKLKK